MSKSTHNRLLELDALRGIAAISVVAFHKAMGTPHNNLFFNYGLTGVDLFFIISGFVILMSLKRAISPRQFIIGRIIRLYPLYWIAVSLAAISLLITGDAALNGVFAIKYLANLTMVHPYFLQGNMDGVYWTLLVELLFYAVMVTLFSFNKLNKIELWGACLLPALFIYALFLRAHIGTWGVRIHRFMPLIEFVPLFLSGVVFYNLKFEQKTVVRFLILAGCFVTQIALFHLGKDRIRWITTYEYILPLTVYYLAFTLYCYNKLGFIVNPVTIFIGTVSYPIYLTHGTVSRLFHATGFFASNFWLELLANICLTTLLSFILFYFIEKPILRFAKGRWMSSPKKTPELARA
ncbi:acyltransferase [Mucilaginibacter sp. PAMB04168]|uniref:acyltransferase family protein n=1 Tax=Mucilaginibacter sp. PAMB04168 TaxID=3138567 RepID=UPI0031F66633